MSLDLEHSVLIYRDDNGLDITGKMLDENGHHPAIWYVGKSCRGSQNCLDVMGMPEKTGGRARNLSVEKERRGVRKPE